jgi:RNA polymerase sigma-70 factor (ECF subfamily)
MTDPIGEKLVALLPRLRRYARSLTGSTTDADDLVQSALEKALRSAHQWTPGTRLDWWMFCIVRSVRVDQLRKRSEAALDAGAVEKSLAPVDGPKVVESRLMLDAVRRAFARLSEEQREILHLVCVDGLAYREAAEILGIPLGTVMSRLSRARLALHEALATRDAAKDAEEDRPMEKGH